MRVAVIGAGLVGAAVSRELAARGAEVTVLEQTGPGAGTSGTTFAWVNSHDKDPEPYHRLNVAGCDEHRRLARSLDRPGWYAGNGNVEWAEPGPGQERLEARVARLEARGYACRWIDAEEARRLEPDLRITRGTQPIAYFPDEAYVLPALLLGRLLGEARDHGAVLRTPAHVVALERGAAGVDVVLASGDREGFDRVVSCVGRWTTTAAWADPVRLVDPEEPGGAAVGYLAYTAPLPVRLSRMLTTPRVNVRPDGGGRVVLQGLDRDAEADPASVPAADGDVARDLAGRLTDVLDVPGPVPVGSVRVGQRALPADGRTVAGFDEVGDERVYLVATHSGVTLGPLLGRLVAQEVLGGDVAELLDGFRPSRFAAHGGGPETVRAARLPGEQ